MAPALRVTFIEINELWRRSRILSYSTLRRIKGAIYWLPFVAVASMSRLKRDIRGKKLIKLLGRADDEAFLQMIWAVDALQSDRVPVAGRYIQFPASAATSDIAAPNAIHSWELETLV